MIGRPKLVLASGSPRRLSLVNQVGHRARRAASDRYRRDAEARRAAARLRHAARPPEGGSGAEHGAHRRRTERRLHPRRRYRGRGRPPHSAESGIARRSGAVLAAVVRPQSPRPYRGLPGDAEGDVPAAPCRDPRALQAAVGPGHRSLSRVRRMARQGRRLCGAGHRRKLPGEDRRLLFQHRRPAALRDHDAVGGEGYPIHFGWLNTV